MTDALHKLIEESTDDRLAKVVEVLLDGASDEAIQKATRIAEGGV
jgi:transcription initiation factor IIE alpha subunit